jgi:hypothetical protein
MDSNQRSKPFEVEISKTNLYQQRIQLIDLTTKPVWEQAGYQIMVALELQGDRLIIEFANQDQVTINASELFELGPVKKCELVNQSHLNVFLDLKEVFSVPYLATWEQVRELADPEFAAYYDRLREQENKILGKGLTALRERKQLSIEQVVKLCKQYRKFISFEQINRQVVIDIEAGKEIYQDYLGRRRLHRISTAEIVEVLSDGEELIPLGKLAQLGRE